MLASVKSIQGLKVSVLKREKFPLYVKKKKNISLGYLFKSLGY